MKDLCGHLLRRGAFVRENSRRAAVGVLDLAGIELLVDGGADDRMDERQGAVRAKDVRPGKRTGEMCRELAVEIRVRSRAVGCHVVPEHRDGARERDGLRRQPREPCAHRT